ncbi:hypothetical protein KEJ39_05890 [Candidatus Bathyarchaeota archaeon]|nr:hypothetical protein [Candidatus Bathyarchaeota archaeon]
MLKKFRVEVMEKETSRIVDSNVEWSLEIRLWNRLLPLLDVDIHHPPRCYGAEQAHPGQYKLLQTPLLESALPNRLHIGSSGREERLLRLEGKCLGLKYSSTRKSVCYVRLPAASHACP